MVVFGFSTVSADSSIAILYLLKRSRLLGQIRVLDGVLHHHDFRDVLATSISYQRGQLLGTLTHQIQRLDHFERVDGLLLGVLLRNLLRDLLRDILLVPERVPVAKLRRCFVDLRSQRTSSATMQVFKKLFACNYVFLHFVFSGFSSFNSSNNLIFWG